MPTVEIAFRADVEPGLDALRRFEEAALGSALRTQERIGRERLGLVRSEEIQAAGLLREGVERRSRIEETFHSRRLALAGSTSQKLAEQDAGVIANFAAGWSAAFARWSENVLSATEQGKNLFESFAQASSRAFSDVLFQGLKGKTLEFEDIWQKFTDSLLRAFTDMVARMAVAWAVSGVANLFGGLSLPGLGPISLGGAPGEIPLASALFPAGVLLAGGGAPGAAGGLAALNAQLIASGMSPAEAANVLQLAAQEQAIGASMAGLPIGGGAGATLGSILGTAGISLLAGRLASTNIGGGGGAVLAGGAAGALTGAALGTFLFPGVGTALGAALGGGAGILSRGVEGVKSLGSSISRAFKKVFDEGGEIPEPIVGVGLRSRGLFGFRLDDQPERVVKGATPPGPPLSKGGDGGGRAVTINFAPVVNVRGTDVGTLEGRRKLARELVGELRWELRRLDSVALGRT